MNKATISKIWHLAVQIVFFILFPEVFQTAFSGVKYIFSALGKGNDIRLNSFVVTFVLMVMLTIVFGRFFCGYLCAFGTCQDVLTLISGLCFRKSKRPRLKYGLTKIMGYLRYILLFIILLLCFLGLWEKTARMSPWDVFSMITVGHIRMKGYTAGLVILIALSVFSFFEPRFFCRFFCPMGAIYSLLPDIGLKKAARLSNTAWMLIRAIIYGILFYMTAELF